jgi:hypothetical protein
MRKPSTRARERTAARPQRNIGLKVAFFAILVAAAAFGAWRDMNPPAEKPPTQTAALQPANSPGVAARSLPTPTPAPTPAPSATPQRPQEMSASTEAAFDAWLIDAFKSCWSPPRSLPDGDPYAPRVRIALKADGALAGAPRLVNPPSDPAWKPFADSAVRAIKSCEPLRIPTKYAAYYPQWKTETVVFDPDLKP